MSISVVLQYENFNLCDVVTPVKADKLEQLLTDYRYDVEKTKFLINGFRNGFSIGYKGSADVKLTSPNLILRVGNKTELWNKVMKEVKEGRYAGPFEKIPFANYIQSPIGLVPKDGGTKTRLIFHLSYPKNGTTSINHNTPKADTKVDYPKFQDAVKLCELAGLGACAAKSDLTSAFRQLGIKPEHWKYLVMKAESPINHKIYYFVDKCLPFGAAISCKLFQEFSNALSFIMKNLTQFDNVNYLDDFFFVALIRKLVNDQVTSFLNLCSEINLPVSLEKTFWGSNRIVFLGLLIDTVRQIISIPVDKIDKAIQMIQKITQKKSKKATVNEMQQICGFLNFIGQCIIPGRAFTRRLYALSDNKRLSKYHHVQIKSEHKLDLLTWLAFLKSPTIYSRPFIDLNGISTAHEIEWYTDASASLKLGCGGYHKKQWFVQMWETSFMNRYKPSINYLELYAVTVSILLWTKYHMNKRIILFCDNQSVVSMINNTTSSCKNCMVLIRLIVLQCLQDNVRIYAKYVRSADNYIADILSRNKMSLFKILAANKGMDDQPQHLPAAIWPMEKIYLN